MKLAKTLLAVALPFVLSAGCALDVGSSADGLTIETNNDFGINRCGQTSQQWIDDDARWPVDTIVAGDMQFTKDELVSYLQTNPGTRAELIAEMAAVQLNMAVGLEIPGGLLEELEAADGLLMADESGTGTPPPVAIDDFANLRGYNTLFERDCFVNVAEVAQITPGIKDLRPDLVVETPNIIDVRPNLVAE